MNKKPMWPVALGLGALAVIGGGAGVYWWKSNKRPAAKTTHSSVPSNVSAKLAAHRGTCPEGYVFVPAGTFTMGDGQGTDDERPAHPVKLSAYCIGGTEVTVTEFRACVKEKRGDLQCTAPRTMAACNWNNPARSKHPVNCVDWAQADIYCKWAGGALPTEAQWEYAARGGDGRAYPWGNEPPNAKLLNACGTECSEARHGRTMMFDKSDRFLETAPVGMFPDGASPFGALDMAGNVEEWVSDWYGPYQAGEANDPTGPASAGAEPWRTTRGGNYFTGEASRVRGAARDKATPAGGRTSGFRCVHKP